jgi:hypothetical protein
MLAQRVHAVLQLQREPRLRDLALDAGQPFAGRAPLFLVQRA